jgi:3-isopropylmalate/(R)-2-methylmalate dehydratase small subunit
MSEVIGAAAAILRPNIDPMIIAPRTPAEKGGAATQGAAESVKSTDLFRFWRFNDDGTEVADFVLNRPAFREARFLIAGPNFGCGSAREHAVWALRAFGIRAVIAPSFGPLFQSGCFKNGIVPVELAESETVRLAEECAPGAPSALLTLDLEKLLLVSPRRRELTFALPEFRRRQLRDGLDEIDTTLQSLGDIERFYRKASVDRPWMYRREELS